MVRQHIGDMHCLDAIPLVTDISVQVHQTGEIGGNNIIGARLQRMIDLLVGHGDGDGLEFYRKTAAKPTSSIVGSRTVAHCGVLAMRRISR